MNSLKIHYSAFSARSFSVFLSSNFRAPFSCLLFGLSSVYHDSSVSPPFLLISSTIFRSRSDSSHRITFRASCNLASAAARALCPFCDSSTPLPKSSFPAALCSSSRHIIMPSSRGTRKSICALEYASMSMQYLFRILVSLPVRSFCRRFSALLLPLRPFNFIA